MSSIQELPELALLTIFDNIPLLDLIHIDEVCVRFGELKSAALNRRKHLIIVNDESDLKALDNPNNSFDMLRSVKNDDGSPFCKIKVRLDRHALYASEITPLLLDNIVEKLPNLKVIRVIQLDGSYNELWKIKYLLQQYRTQLVDVTVWFWGNFNNEDLDVVRNGFKSMFVSLMHTLNSMKALTGLQLNFQTPMALKVSIPFELSIASRLKVLNVRTYGFSGADVSDSLVLEQTFKQYCEINESLEEVYMENPMQLATALSYGPRVSAAIREVHLDNHLLAADCENFKKFGAQYFNIIDLTISVATISMDKIAKALAPCTQLVHLALNANFDEGQGPVVPVNKTKPDKLTVLPNVKSLSLFIDTGSHKDFEKMNLDIIFPNVQVILLRHNCMHCRDCNYRIPHEVDVSEIRAYSRQVHECMRQARISFINFTKLTLLKANLGISHLNSNFHDENFTLKTLAMDTTFMDDFLFQVNDF